MNKFKKFFPLSFKLGKSVKGFVLSMILHTAANLVALGAFLMGVVFGGLLLIPSIFILPLALIELLIVAFLLIVPAVVTMYATFGFGLSIMRFCGVFDK